MSKTLQAIAARRAAAIEATQAANAETIRTAAETYRLQRLILRLVEAGGFTLSDKQAGNAIREAAEAIREGGRIARFETAEKIETTDDRAFVVAIVRQALDTKATAAELGRLWNGGRTGGSLRDAANWLYEQVGFGHWKEPPKIPEPVKPTMTPAAGTVDKNAIRESQLPTKKRTEMSGQADTNSGQNKSRKQRPMNDAARACIRDFKRRIKNGERLRMKQHCREYAKDHQDSETSLYRTITDNPQEWKETAQRTK